MSKEEKKQEYMDRLNSGHSIFIGDGNDIHEDVDFINFLQENYKWFNKKYGFTVFPKVI